MRRSDNNTPRLVHVTLWGNGDVSFGWGKILHVDTVSPEWADSINQQSGIFSCRQLSYWVLSGKEEEEARRLLLTKGVVLQNIDSPILFDGNHFYRNAWRKATQEERIESYLEQWALRGKR